MTKEEFAALLNGREYLNEMTKAEEEQAKAAGLLVIFGASDDLVELRGVTYDEVGAYEGTTLRVMPDGRLLPDLEEVQDSESADELREYFLNEAKGWHEVEVVWCPETPRGASWAYETALPHATFDIMEDGEVYCRGIVLAVADFASVPLKQVG